jgi:hypothetical protein
MKKFISHSKRSTKQNKSLINISKFFFCKENNSDKIKFNNVKDVKAFGRKFSDEELKKYLDPYGFLNSTKGK